MFPVWKVTKYKRVVLKKDDTTDPLTVNTENVWHSFAHMLSLI